MLFPIHLKKTVGEAYNVSAQDTLNTKQALARLGHMEIPDYGLDQFPDTPMVDAIKSFQRAEGLEPDGVMKPDGPTLDRLNASLEAQQFSPATASARKTADQHPTEERTQLAQMRESGRMPGSVTARGAAQRIFEKLQNSQAPSAAAAGAAGALLSKKVKERTDGQASSRMAPAPSFPPPPGYEPPDMPLPDRTETIPQPIEIPDLSSPLPKTDEPTIFISPIPKLGEFGPHIWESRGNEKTRKHLERVRDWFLENNAGWQHYAGGRNQADRSEITEYYIPGPGYAFPRPGKSPGSPGDGRAGSKRTDLTFVSPDGKTFVHIQTVDVDKYGKPTDRELDNAEKARRGLEGRRSEGEIHHILLVGKDWMMPK